MLISLRVENFRSIRDRLELRMDASPNEDLSDQHVVRKNVAGLPKNFKGMLTVASIHGANASGKSNVVKAANLLVNLIRFAFRSPDGLDEEFPSRENPNHQVEPFLLDQISSELPTTFEITFLLDGIRWAYGLEIDRTKIHSEWLLYWPKGRKTELFRRGNAARITGESAWQKIKGTQVVINFDADPHATASAKRGGKPVAPPLHVAEHWKSVTIAEDAPPGEYWSWGDKFENGISEGQALAGRTRKETPFLSVAASWNHPQASHVVEWINRFQIYDATYNIWQRNRVSFVANACDKNAEIHEWIQRWMRAADFGISAIRIDKPEPQKDHEDVPRRMLGFRAKAIHQTAQGNEISFDMEQESNGTMCVFSLAHTLYFILKTGGVFVVDELHTSLHPLLLRALIRIFQSPIRNPMNAQLIFTTHDISVLDNTLLRRDQMHIVEKGKDGASEIYSVADCDYKPRATSPLLKYYLSGNLGGVPDLDLEELFPITNPLPGEDEE